MRVLLVLLLIAIAGCGEGSSPPGGAAVPPPPEGSQAKGPADMPQAKVDGRGTRINANAFSGSRLRYHIEVESSVVDTSIGTNSFGALVRQPIETNASKTILELTGTGPPKLSAAPASRYYRTDGVAGATLYVKESGLGSTGWVAK